jgi:hypothetical protein
VTEQGRVRVQKQVVEGNDPQGGHGRICEGDRARVGVNHGMVEVHTHCVLGGCHLSLSLCRRGFHISLASHKFCFDPSGCDAASLAV